MKSGKTVRRISAYIAVACGCILLTGCVTTDWKTAKQQGTLEAYRAFVEKNPDSSYSAEARAKIRAFEERNKKAREDEAYAALSKADTTGTETAFLGVASRYSDTAAGREAVAATERRVSTSERRTNPTEKWASDWNAFVTGFQPYFDKGEMTGDEKAELAKTMHGALVTWTGRVKSKDDGSISMSMPYASLTFKVVTRAGYYGATTTNVSDYVADSLTITPKWNNRRAWAQIKPGAKVSFRTSLVGCGLGQVWIGAGPNAGKIFVMWETDDAELVDTKN